MHLCVSSMGGSPYQASYQCVMALCHYVTIQLIGSKGLTVSNDRSIIKTHTTEGKTMTYIPKDSYSFPFGGTIPYFSDETMAKKIAVEHGGHADRTDYGYWIITLPNGQPFTFNI